MSALARLLGGRVVRNTTYLLAANGASKVFALLLNALIVRELSDDGFGAFRTVIAYAGIFANFAELGLLRAGVQAVARAPQLAGRFFGEIVWTKTLTGLATAVLLVVWTERFFPDPTFRALSYLWLGVLLAQSAKRACDCVFMGVQRMGFSAGFLFANRVGTFLVAWIYFQFDRSIVNLFVVFLAFEIVEAVVQWIAVRRVLRAAGVDDAAPVADLGSAMPGHEPLDEVLVGGTSESASTPSSNVAAAPSPLDHRSDVDAPPRRSPLAWLRTSLPFGLQELTVEISARLDSVLLYVGLASFTAVAAYNKAYLILTSVLMLPNALCQALFPSLSEMFRRDRAAMVRYFRAALPIFVLMGPALAVGLVIVKEPILWLLRGNTEEVTRIYYVALSALPIYFGTFALSYFLGAVDRQRDVMIACAIGALGNIALNLWLIPRHGALGAAFATVATESLVILLYLRALAPSYGGIFDARRLTLILAAQAVVLVAAAPLITGSAAARAAFCLLYLPPLAWFLWRQRVLMRAPAL